MKQLLLALATTFAFGTAFAQTTVAEPVATPLPATTVQADASAPQTEAPAPAAGQVPGPAVKKATPRVSKAFLGAGLAGIALIAVVAGGGDSDNNNNNNNDDRPSSP